MIWVISFWLVVMFSLIIWAAASLHWENRDLKQSIAMLRHPSRQSWGCVCGAITLSNQSEISDGNGMTHRAHDRCVPDLEVL